MNVMFRRQLIYGINVLQLPFLMLGFPETDWGCALTTQKQPDNIAIQSALYEAVGFYRDAMRPFLVQVLQQVENGDVATVIKSSLSEGHARQFEDALVQNDGSIEASIDVAMFGRLVRHNWDNIFREQFNHAPWESIVNTLGVIQDARNRISHPTPNGLEEGYVLARLHDIGEILRCINAVDAKRAVEEIRGRLAHAANANHAASDAAAAEAIRKAEEREAAAVEAIRKAEEREAAAVEATRKADQREAVAGRAIRKAEDREMAAVEAACETAAREAATPSTKPASTQIETAGKPTSPTLSPEALWELWREALGYLRGTKGPQGSYIDALLRDCRRNSVRMSVDRTTLVLPFSNNANLERMLQELSTRWVGDAIADAIEKSFGERLGFVITLAARQSRPEYTYPGDSPPERVSIGYGRHSALDADDLPF